MRLADFLAGPPAIPSRGFAKTIGVSEGYLSRLIDGTRTPSMEVAGRIRDATDGAVTADDFMPESEPDRRRQPAAAR